MVISWKDDSSKDHTISSFFMLSAVVSSGVPMFPPTWTCVAGAFQAAPR